MGTDFLPGIRVLSLALEGYPLDIRLVSSLTPEDETRYAKVFVQLMAAVLDSLPIAYAINVELTNGTILRLPESGTPRATAPAP